MESIHDGFALGSTLKGRLDRKGQETSKAVAAYVPTGLLGRGGTPQPGAEAPGFMPFAPLERLQVSRRRQRPSPRIFPD